MKIFSVDVCFHTYHAAGRVAAAAELESGAVIMGRSEMTMTDTRRIDAALAVLRVLAGVVFAAHGGQKLFVYGFAGVAGAFEGMGIPMAGVAGPAVALIELLGGIALVLGVFTRYAAAGLAVVMLGAMTMVHLPGGFFLPNGIEFVLVLLGISVALLLAGPGAFSLDRRLLARRAEL